MIVPVVYIIGNAGIPLEIIPGQVSATDLILKINKAYQVLMVKLINHIGLKSFSLAHLEAIEGKRCINRSWYASFRICFLLSLIEYF